MGAFKIEILGVGGHGCERKAKAGDKLHGRCGRFNCPDCMAFEFAQQLRQKGMVRDGDGAYSVEITEGVVVPEGATVIEEDKYEYNAETKQSVVIGKTGRKYYQVTQSALFTHWPESPTQVIDDMLKNERKEGSF